MARVPIAIHIWLFICILTTCLILKYNFFYTTKSGDIPSPKVQFNRHVTASTDVRVNEAGKKSFHLLEQLTELKNQVANYLKEQPTKENQFKRWAQQYGNITDKKEIKMLWKMHKKLQDIR